MPVTFTSVPDGQAYSIVVNTILENYNVLFRRDLTTGTTAGNIQHRFGGVGAPIPNTNEMIPYLADPDTPSTGSQLASNSSLRANDRLRPVVGEEGVSDDVRLIIWAKDFMRNVVAQIQGSGVSISVNFDSITVGVNIIATLKNIATAFNAIVTVWNANLVALQRTTAANADGDFPAMRAMPTFP